MVHTYDNTTFDKWQKLASMAFFKRGLPMPTMKAALDAYEVGESPETWADYVRYTPVCHDCCGGAPL